MVVVGEAVIRVESSEIYTPTNCTIDAGRRAKDAKRQPMEIEIRRDIGRGLLQSSSA